MVEEQIYPAGKENELSLSPTGGFINTESVTSAGTLITFHNLKYSVVLPGPKKPFYSKVISKLRGEKRATAAVDIDSPQLQKPVYIHEKVILKSISGCFRSGRVTAILGPSGGGKTSLLTAIGGITVAGKIDGNIRVNGRECNKQVLRALCGFVHQDDVILGTMTVEEALQMALFLRTEGLTKEKFDKRIELVSETLLLSGAMKTVIGSSTIKGVSGGERKRTAIGMELMSGSPILLLDECTSGLDTYSAYSVINTLKRISSQGTTIVASLHQPSSEIFELLDDVIILVGGEILYMGPTNLMVKYFSKLGHQCPEYNNPPDYVFMQIIRNNSQEKLRELISYGNESQNTFLKEAITSIQPDLEVAIEEVSEESSKVVRFKHIPTAYRQLHYLSLRTFRNMKRNPLLIKANFGQAIFLSILVGSLYYGLESTNEIQQNSSGALFFMATNLFIGQSIGMMSTFATERPVFVREYSSGYYGVLTYFLSKNIVELPVRIIQPIIFSIICYWMIGFSKDWVEFIVFTALCILQSLTGNAYGLLIAASFEDLAVSLAILPVSILPLMLLGGLLVSANANNAWISWIQWISPVQYMFTAQMQNYWEKKKATDINGIKINGHDFLTTQGIDKRLSLPLNFLMLFVLFIFSTVLAYYGLRRLAMKSGGVPFLSRKKREKWALSKIISQ